MRPGTLAVSTAKTAAPQGQGRLSGSETVPVLLQNTQTYQLSEHEDPEKTEGFHLYGPWVGRKVTVASNTLEGATTDGVVTGWMPKTAGSEARWRVARESNNSTLDVSHAELQVRRTAFPPSFRRT